MKTYADGHHRYRIVDEANNDEVLMSSSQLFEAQVMLTKALNDGVDAYLMDAGDTPQ